MNYFEIDNSNETLAIRETELNKLSNAIDDLQFQFEFPRLYLSKYFDDLRYKVDMHSAKQINSFESNASDIYFKMIHKIDSYEKECTKDKNVFISSFIRFISKSLEAIKDRCLNL